jgi:hypothetical protein
MRLRDTGIIRNSRCQCKMMVRREKGGEGGEEEERVGKRKR